MKLYLKDRINHWIKFNVDNEPSFLFGIVLIFVLPFILFYCFIMMGREEQKIRWKKFKDSWEQYKLKLEG